MFVIELQQSSALKTFCIFCVCYMTGRRKRSCGELLCLSNMKFPYLFNTPTNLCIALYCILLCRVILNCNVLLIYCYVDIIQYNAVHKFVGVLDNPRNFGHQVSETTLLMMKFRFVPKSRRKSVLCSREILLKRRQIVTRTFTRTFLESYFCTILYIACKIHQNYKPLWRAFSGLIQQICRPINVLANKEGVSFALLSLQSGSKCKLKTLFGN